MIGLGVLFLVFVAFLFIASKSSYVQTRLARGVANYLSARLDAEVSIDRVDFRLWRSYNLKGFLIKDQFRDTLLYAGEIDAGIEVLSFRENRFEFDHLDLSNGSLRLRKIDSSGTVNLDFLTDFFSSEKADSAESKPFLFRVNSLILSEMEFRYTDLFEEGNPDGVMFNDLLVDQIHAEFRDFEASGDSLLTRMDELRFNEKSGFSLETMQSNLKLAKGEISAGNLTLKTKNSDIKGFISLNHEEWSDYREFLSTIRWKSEFSASLISSKDIAYFAPEIGKLDLDLILHGQIDGPIANLNGRNMVILAGDRTVLRGDIDLTGLPDFENTFIDFRISEFRTGYADILNIGKGITNDSTWAETLPVELKRAGDLAFEGYFTGFPQDFVTFGNLDTDIGSLNLDVNLRNDTLLKGIEYTGSIEALGIDAGELFAIENLSKVSGEFDLTAFSRKTFEEAYLQGRLSSLTFREYAYRDIILDGELSKNRFSGTLRSDDPNIDLDFDGIIDFSGDIPFYDFDANVNNFNLSALNLVDLDREFSFTTQLSLDAKGKEIRDIAGAMLATNTMLCYGDSSLIVNDTHLTIFGDSLNRKINFDSDVADITITGQFDPVELPAAFNNLLAEVMPSLARPKEITSDEDFQFSINYVSDNSFTSLLIPELMISSNTTVYGSLDTKSRTFELLLRSPLVSYGDMTAEALTADIGKLSEVFKARLFANQFVYDSLIFENPDLDVEAYNDFVDVKTGWYGRTVNSSADLNAHIDFFDRNHFILEVEPGYFNVRDITWQLDEKALFELDSVYYKFENLMIHSGNQEIVLDGILSPEAEDTLKFEINNFRLSTLDSMGIGGTPQLTGLLNLNGRVTDFFDETNIRSDGEVLNFQIEDQSIGDVLLITRYGGRSQSLGIQAEMKRQALKPITFNGDYALDGSQHLTGKLSLQDFDLGVLNAIGIPQISDFGGSADGNITVSGRIDAPELKGFIQFEEAKFRVDYLNTEFTFSDRVRVEPDFFGIDYKPIYDDAGNKGFVVASAFHDNFGSWSYDISADVRNFHALNTTREDNELYFGQAYATGTIELGGFDEKLEVNIDARTEKGTNISLPLDRSDEVALENFVHFVSEEDQESFAREVDLTGVSMSLTVDATPDAQIRLIFDEKAGDILTGRGAGKITLETTNSGEFNMFGRYEVLSGNYNFTLRNLINKQFDIRPGGTIGWYGDPYNADLDLTALYSLRTPLYPIMIENRELYRSREVVNVLMDLGGKLTNPSINFKIELPQATENERSQLASAVSSTNQLNQQVFALLILNKFIAISAPDQAGTGVVSGLAAFGQTNTSELISNQLSSWLSDISNEFDIGLNYRPGDQITNQEIAVALSTQLFDERLFVSGSFGVTSANEAQYTEGQSGILGDFLLEYMLTPDGKIRLRVFNETNPYEVFSTSTSMYTQGVGLVYQEDFDTIDEFFKKVGELFKDDKAESIP